MRIVVANWTTRRYGGVESYLSGVVPALQDAGHEVAFVAESDIPANRERIPLGDAPAWVVAEAGLDGVERAVRDWRPDVVYAHNFADAELERLAQRVAPSVWTAHAYYGTCVSGTKTHRFPTPTPCGRKLGWGCLAHYYPHRCGGWNPVTMVRRFVAESARRARFGEWGAIVTISAHMQAEYARHSPAPERVVELPCWDPLLGEPVEAAPRPADAPLRLLFAGRLDREKGAAVAVEALPEVARRLARPVRLVLAGDGPDRERVERAVAAAVRTPGVTVEQRGWVAPEEIERAMRDADLLVVPSLWPEPFGLVGPEAGSRGVPAAAFAVGGIPSWLTDGVNGHLAPADPPRAAALADAIVRATADPAHHARLRAGAARLARRFSRERHLEALLPLLARVAGAARPVHHPPSFAQSPST